ncbi:sulfatase [Flavobacteriaceae bacterium]|jgi:arylsulfatase A-like enzyme|nr:sulfatase [Flavobacteriaceae bacterium]
MSKKKIIGGGFLVAFLFWGYQSESQGVHDPLPNILFIAVDDLRPELSVYGNPIIKTPNIDQLANTGSLFTNHYVQVPTCGASRFSMMTGMRPRKRVHIGNDVFYKETANQSEKKEPESFVHHFKRNGYTTVGIGKLSHSVDGWVYGYNEQPSKVKEMPHSWDRFVFNPGKWKTGWNAFFAYANGENRQRLNNQVKPYEMGKVSDEGYPDGLILKSALEELKKLKVQQKPFFMGVGFFKPHLPFNAPKKYWDLYDRSTIPIAPDPFIPEGINPASIGKMGEFYNYQLSDEKPNLDHPISNDYARKLIHGYYASISYVDNLIGKLLRELKSLEMDQNTIIVLWGDHGWHLGNDLKWGKHSLFERSLKSALIIKLPGNNPTQKKIATIVESVDLYPTLLEYCGIKSPYDLDGKSLLGLMKSIPEKSERIAFSYFKNGISLRTDRYRFTKFYRKEKPNLELYDHRIDPEENQNIANHNQEMIQSLMPLLDGATPEFYQELIED